MTSRSTKATGQTTGDCDADEARVITDQVDHAVDFAKDLSTDDDRRKVALHSRGNLVVGPGRVGGRRPMQGWS